MTEKAKKEKKRILIIEDEYRIVESLKFNLEGENYIVHHASLGKEGLELFRRRKPDLILLDLMLPEGQSGIDILREIRQEDSNIPVIIITAKTTEIDEVVGMEMEADDYITKPFSMAVLKSHIKRRLKVAAQKGAIEEKEQEPKEINIGDIHMNYAQRECKIQGKPVKLGYKEFEILWYLANNPNQVFKREQIMEEVWQVDQPLDTKTVDVHIRWIRKKIEPKPEAPRYIETVRGVGYKFSSAHQDRELDKS